MQVFVAILLQKIVDHAVQKNSSAFMRLVVIAVFYFIIMGLMDYLTGTTQAIYLKKTMTKVKEDLFRGILSKEYLPFYKENTAEYISYLTNDMNLVQTNFIVPYLMMIGDVVIFLLTTIVLLSMNLWITMALFVTAGLMPLVPVFFGKKLEQYQSEVSTSLGWFTTSLKEMFQGYEIIKSYNIEDTVTADFTKDNTELESAKLKSAHVLAIVNALCLVLAISSILSGVAIAGYFVIIGTMTVGSLLAVLQLGNGIQGPIGWIIQKYSMIRGMKSINKRLLGIMEEGKKIKEGKELEEFEGAITLEEVTFGYEDDTKVIDHLSFSFQKNKKYAIVGKSGSGKSTLAKLILGYYDGYEGKIFFDHEEIKGIRQSSLSNFISIIHQNIFLFDKTIEENILLSKTFSSEEIEKVLNISGVKSFIDTLPKGIKTEVGENGSSLSGGQRQRVAIARALMQDTPTLVLDEGTSALDAHTAFDIEDTLLDIQDLTVITITHRLAESLLSKYDAILVMEQGRIVESGSFKELMQRKEMFYDLYNRQGMGKDTEIA